MPFRQTSNATLKASLQAVKQISGTIRGNEPASHRHTTGANTISCPVGDDERPDVRCGHSN